jgi:uncharacterized membrane protein YjjP (DUF1212 family)
MDTAEQLDLLAHTGVLLLENGAATYRVDETLASLGKAFGLPKVGIYATATGLIIAAEAPGGSATRVRVIKRHDIDLNMLAELNRLSREAAEGVLAPEQIAARIAALEANRRQYPIWLVVTGVAIACGAFGLLIGADWREFTATAVAAALAAVLKLRLVRLRFIPLMVTVLTAFAATAASWLGCRALACQNANLAEISAVLQLVPGVLLLTAIVDLTTGDMLSGVARAAYGLLIVLGIALGMLLFLVWGLS